MLAVGPVCSRAQLMRQRLRSASEDRRSKVGRAELRLSLHGVTPKAWWRRARANPPRRALANERALGLSRGGERTQQLRQRRLARSKRPVEQLRSFVQESRTCLFARHLLLRAASSACWAVRASLACRSASRSACSLEPLRAPTARPLRGPLRASVPKGIRSATPTMSWRAWAPPARSCRQLKADLRRIATRHAQALDVGRGRDRLPVEPAPPRDARRPMAKRPIRKDRRRTRRPVSVSHRAFGDRLALSLALPRWLRQPALQRGQPAHRNGPGRRPLRADRRRH